MVVVEVLGRVVVLLMVLVVTVVGQAVQAPLSTRELLPAAFPTPKPLLRARSLRSTSQNISGSKWVVGRGLPWLRPWLPGGSFASKPPR